MKPSIISSLLAPLLLVAPSTARVAQVYISDPKSYTDVEAPSFSASTARLIFARRLGLSEYHTLKQDDIDGGAIEALNAYGGETQGLFGSDSSPASQSITFVEGYDNPSDVLPEVVRKHALRFSIDSAPSPQENDKLLQDLQAQHAALAQQYFTQTGVRSSELGVASVAKGHTGSDADIGADLLKVAVHDHGAIFVFMEAASPGSISKRSSTTWGTYMLAQKRQSEFFSGRPDITPDNPADPVEVDLLPGDEEVLSSSQSSTHPWYDDVVAQQDEDEDDDDDKGSSNTTAPAGILPQCFSSESACKKTTNDCSGHGSCESRYKYSEGSKTVQCYACSCNATVQGEGNLKLTTHWSGPACQKKDVSTPFWLLSGITLGLVLVVTWGVGLLYSMGQEELPSVIGAGVAGPRPK